jgi:hypothetical protein
MGQKMWGYRCVLAVAAALAIGFPVRAEDESQKTDSKAYSRIEAERRIEAALDLPLRAPLEFIETPLNQVTEVLAEDYDIPIQFDASALDAIASSPEVEVTINVANVSLRSALELLFRNAGAEGLTYIIDHEVLLITTQEEAEKRLETRVYRVDDLVIDDQTDASWGYDADFDQLIDVIVATVDHESWMENRTGEGEIQPFSPGMLVVTQTRRTHSRVEALLELLRETKQAVAADLAGRSKEASRRPVTRAIELDDEVIASCPEARKTIQNVLQNSVNWSLVVEGATADELFLKVLPHRILVRHAPQVVRQVERMAKVVSPPDQTKFAGQTGATPDLAEPTQASEDGEQRQQAGGEGDF